MTTEKETYVTLIDSDVLQKKLDSQFKNDAIIIEPLCQNLALIRETLRMLYQEAPDKNLEDAYNYLGLTTKDFTNLFATKSLSKEKLNVLQERLAGVGFYKKHIVNLRTCAIVLPPEVQTEVACFLNDIATNKDKDSWCDVPQNEKNEYLSACDKVRQFSAKKLRQAIRLHFLLGDKQISRLVLCCYRIMYYASLKNENNNILGKLALEKFLISDLNDVGKRSDAFVDYLKKLSKTPFQPDVTETKSTREILGETHALIGIILNATDLNNEIKSKEYAILLRQIAQIMLTINKSKK